MKSINLVEDFGNEQINSLLRKLVLRLKSTKLVEELINWKKIKNTKIKIGLKYDMRLQVFYGRH